MAFKGISLFSGIGGLDFGFEEAGFETRVALERDRHACAAMRLNSDWEIIEDDINKVASKDVLVTRRPQGRRGRCADWRPALPAILEVGLLGER